MKLDTLLRLTVLTLLWGAHLMGASINVPAIFPNYTATGADLSGLLVTIVHDFPPRTTSPGPGLYSYTFTWRTLGVGWGGAGSSPGPPEFTPRPVLELNGNSATAMWKFNGYFADPIVSLSLDGTAAGIFFDRALPSPGTAGTGTGNDAFALGTIPASYSNPVGVGGATPVGDLYSQVQFNFFRDIDGPFTFRQTTVLAIPEPNTWTPSLACLVFLLGSRRLQWGLNHCR